MMSVVVQGVVVSQGASVMQGASVTQGGGAVTQGGGAVTQGASVTQGGGAGVQGAAKPVACGTAGGDAAAGGDATCMLAFTQIADFVVVVPTKLFEEWSLKISTIDESMV
jgi:hypothetical protein